MIGPTRPRLVASAIVLAMIAAAGAACTREAPPPIQVRDIDVVVQNQTGTNWEAVEIWVNDHFRGLAPTLAPTQQLVVPLRSLQGPYGQMYDPHRQAVFGVLVKARSADGHDVRLTWGKVRRQ